ncbi:MAG TPA: PDGLE domain-containing protein [bacterium]|nr:PDGLE domain-containing protein [bacterium]
MKTFTWVALAVALLLGVAVAPFASSRLDGLERVAEDNGFPGRGEGEPLVSSPVPDYAFPGVGSEGWATAAAGAVGTLLTFAVAFGLAAALRRRRDK